MPQLSLTLNRQAEEPLPDPEGDPAQLMRNIYTIQNRYLPHDDMPDRTSEPEDEETPAEPAPAAEPEEESAEKEVPEFEPEDGEVVKVSDIVTEDVGTMDTDEFIAQSAALGDRPLGEAE